MIITIGNIKGGVGKTMLSVNIAIARALSGKDVLLVDGDEQGTASEFTELRTSLVGEAGYTAIRLVDKALRTEVIKLQDKYDDIIIDVGGRNTGSLRAAMAVADAIIIPVEPRSFAIWPISQVAELLNEIRGAKDIRAFSILNSADSQGRDNDEAAEYLREFDGIEFLSNMIVRRKAFPNAAAHGKSVLEYFPRDEKAIKELQELIKTIYNE